MTWLDIVLIVGILASITYSTLKGLIGELFALLAIAVAYFVSNNFHTNFAKILHSFLHVNIPVWLGFILLYLTSWLLVSLIGKIIRKIITISVALKAVDKVGGGAVGALKAVVVSSIVLFPLSTFEFSKPLLKKSVTVPFIMHTFRIATPFSSSDLLKMYEKRIGNITKGVSGRMSDLITGMTTQALSQGQDDISEEDRKKLEKIIQKSLNGQ